MDPNTDLRIKEYVTGLKNDIITNIKSGHNSPSRSHQGSPNTTFDFNQFDFKSPKNINRIIASITHPNKNNYIKANGLFFQPPGNARAIVIKSAPNTPQGRMKINVIECNTISPSASMVIQSPASTNNIGPKLNLLQVPSSITIIDKNQFTTQTGSFSFDQPKKSCVSPHDKGISQHIGHGSLQSIPMAVIAE